MPNLVVLLVLLMTAACQRDEPIQTYRIPKQSPVVMQQRPNPAPGANAGTTPGIRWKVPAGWEERAPSQMRVGSFLIKGSAGQQADMSIVPLSGEAGSDLANINRWRGQI